MLRQLILIAFAAAGVFVAAAVFAQAPAQGTIVKSKSNITNNIVAEADGRLKCLTPAGKPCSAQDVKDALVAINNSHSNIKNLTLAAPDGTLTCQSADGKACTAASASEMNAAIRNGYNVKKVEGTR
jgi:hypothetical protein